MPEDQAAGAKMKPDFKYASVKELFGGEVRYAVPEFQRAFSWRDDQIDDFWGDVLSVSQDGHFLGPVVIHKRDDNTLEIIDGQQRMTVCQMLLALIRDRYVALGDPVRPESGGQPFWIAIEGLIRNSGFSNALKFQSSPPHQDVLQRFILEGPSSELRLDLSKKEDRDRHLKGKKSRNRLLLRAYERLQAKLDMHLADCTSDEERLERVFSLESNFIDHVHVMALEMSNLADAFNLFESLNDRGLRLSAADLLKSHLLGKLKPEIDETRLEEALSDWDELVDSLGGGDISAFLRHYLLTQVDRRVRKDDVFPTFKKFVDDDGARHVLRQVISMGQLYGRLLHPSADEPNFDYLVRLKDIGVSSHRVLLMAAQAAGLSQKEFEKLATAVEALSFRWTLTGKNAQDLENLYQAHAFALLKAKSESWEQVVAALEAALPDDESFAKSFSEARPSTGLAGYALRRLENFLAPGEKHIKPAQTVHVEHIMPKTTTTFWSERILEGSDYDDVVARWGNLTLLASRPNQQIKNGDWSTKVNGIGQGKPGYNRSQITLTTDLVPLPDWGESLIDLRTRWLAKLATHVWRVSPRSEALPDLADVVDDPQLLRS